nr:DUF4091 domain-containing protein [Candidatus Sigynarchaeota archaeon]
MQDGHGDGRVDKHAMPIFFSFFIALSIQIGSIAQFAGTKWLSNANAISILIALMVPALVVAITGPGWVFNIKLRTMVQLAATVADLVTCSWILLTLSTYLDLVGAPPVMQFGYYWLYAHYPVVVHLSLTFFMIIIAAPGAFISNVDPRGKKEGAMLKTMLLLVVPAWLDTYLYSSAGYFWAVLIQAVWFGAYAVVKVVQLANLRGTTVGNASILPEGEGRPAVRNGRNGLLHFIKGLVVFLFLMLMIYSNANILNQVLVRPNYVPMWVQMFPLFLAGCATWGIACKLKVDRFWIAIVSAVILLVNGIMLASRPDSYVVFGPATVVLSCISIPGFLAAGILYTRGMALGRFSQVAWAVMATFFIAGAILIGIAEKAGLYCTRCYENAIMFSCAGLIVWLVGFFISRANGFWNKGRRVVVARASTSSPKEMVAIPPGSNAHKKRVSLKVLLLATAFVAGSLSVVTIAGQAGFTEQVLGTYNSEYYLWLADSTRTIDANYRPNIPASTINSTVRIAMARGEHEGFQVVFTPWNLKNLNVWDFRPLRNLKQVVSNETIGSGNISFYNVDYVPQLSGQYPDRLLPFSRIDTGVSLVGKCNWPIYVDVFVPENASTNNTIDPGLYRTTLQFTCYDYRESYPGEVHTYVNRTVQFILEVEVYNFTISQERHISTEIIWGIPEIPVWQNFYIDHRLDWRFDISPVKAFSATTSNMSITFDWPAYFSQLVPLMDRGMQYFPVTWSSLAGMGQLDLNWTEEIVFSYYLTNLTAQLSNRTTPWGTPYIDHAYFLIRDEPGADIYDNLTQIGQFIHQHAPMLKIMETLSGNFDEYPNDFLQEVDIYCPLVQRWQPSETMPEDDTANGWPIRLVNLLATYNGTREKVLWVYHTHNGFPRSDTEIYMSGMLQRNSFWMHWIYNVTGWLYWSFNYGMDLSGGYGYAGFGESTLVGFGPGDTPIGSLRLERVRDGIEDYEYFWMLDSACKQVEASGNASQAGPGRALLQRVRDLYNEPENLQNLAIFTTNDMQEFTKSYHPWAAPYLQLRAEIGRELGRLASLGFT